MIVMSARKRKEWARAADAKLHRKRHREPEHQQAHAEPEPATAEDMSCRRATAQPNVTTTPQERRDQYVERFIVPWAYGVCLRIKTLATCRDFQGKVDLLTARAECDPYYEDEQERLLCEDEIELSEEPHEHYRQARSEWGRARHLRKIFRLTGVYPMDTGDMDTGEVYEWFLEIHDALVAYRNCINP